MMLTTGTNGNTWENPLIGLNLDKSGLIQFSGTLGENSGILGDMPHGGIGDNSGNVNSETGEFLGENRNIAFLKEELSKENTHEFIVKFLELVGDKYSLESLNKINEKYKHLHHTTTEIRDLMFEMGVFDFTNNWNLKDLKRVYYVLKGTFPIGRAVLVEIKEKKNGTATVSTGAETKTTIDKGGV